MLNRLLSIFGSFASVNPSASAVGIEAPRAKSLAVGGDSFGSKPRRTCLYLRGSGFVYVRLFKCVHEISF